MSLPARPNSTAPGTGDWQGLLCTGTAIFAIVDSTQQDKANRPGSCPQLFPKATKTPLVCSHPCRPEASKDRFTETEGDIWRSREKIQVGGQPPSQPVSFVHGRPRTLTRPGHLVCVNVGWAQKAIGITIHLPRFSNLNESTNINWYVHFRYPCWCFYVATVQCWSPSCYHVALHLRKVLPAPVTRSSKWPTSPLCSS